MRFWAAASVLMVLVGIVVWILWADTTAGLGVALSLVGIASVIAVSLVFFAVGRSEDAERAAAAAPPEREPESTDPPAEDPHPRPALDRRRPRPPRRPS
jgi:hypothetical protein